MYILWKFEISPLRAQRMPNNTWVEETMQEKISYLIYALITDVATHQIGAVFLAH